MMASAQNLPAEASTSLDQLSFRDKMKFFEKEIKAKSDTQPVRTPAKQFSYLAEHEIAKLKQEEAAKTANMSSEQLRSYVASGMADMRPDHDLNHVLSSLNTKRMKNLGTDGSRCPGQCPRSILSSPDMALVS
ncbi:uncharacterized protein LOC143290764 [Babylonia areolata]|uniref:uncharacterized protein LOC143290764 n=1 Tax=Babylonia areolata TaxID=304850 RepID=UPI003FD276B3